LANLLELANWGVDIFRLDAAIFIWKEKGTPCISLPQAFTLLKLFRLVLNAVAPGCVFIGEGVDRMEALLRYFGEGDGVQMMYQFPLTPLLWQALTTGDARAIPKLLQQAPIPPYTHWWIFNGTHDELNLEVVSPETRQILAKHLLPGNLPFKQTSPGLAPAGICGTTFSLLQGNLRKIRLLWQIQMSLGWTPMFYMGEELGLPNNFSFQNDPARQQDNRFVKRNPLPESLKAKRHEPGTTESDFFCTLCSLIQWRKSNPILAAPPQFLDTASNAVLGILKKNSEESIILLANCSGEIKEAFVAGIAKTLQPYEFIQIEESIKQNCPSKNHPPVLF
ncbi:MAG TPA: hypothetical protein VLM37_02250, partial [Fibrobacteraceae bacterium]|nr:hypothetical protein [Fibrobacteraceae bacterium]